MEVFWEMKIALLSDFDGTIVTIDTAEFLLNKFAKGDWRSFETIYEQGEITLEECFQRQAAMLDAPKHLMFDELEQVTSFRPHFKELLEYCKLNHVHFVIVSAGFDFVIHHFLKKLELNQKVEMYAAKSYFTNQGIKFSFPKLLDNSSLDFKEDIVNHYKKQGYTVFYIGDGLSDFNATRHADFAYVIANSKLAELCKKELIPHKEIRDFQSVIDGIKNLIIEKKTTNG